MRASAGKRIGLRAHERAFTIADNASLTTIFVLNVSGSSLRSVAAFLKQLPQALVLTFNRHPRMRAMQVRNEFAMAEIQPQITLETVSKLKLLEIREITGREGHESESWEQYAEALANQSIDRYVQFPYYVRVFQYPDQRRARLFLCCDHYMSDGISGITVLNDIATFASLLSLKDQDKQGSELLLARQQELPLRKPLYELWLDSKPWTTFFARTMLRLLKTLIFTDASMQFKPVIMPRADQADLTMPVQVNSSSILFGQGTSDNMKRALQRCRSEHVTLFGAIAASVLVAYYVTCDEEKRRQTSPFKLGFEVVANMRDRVPEPVPEVQVGTYMNSYALECLLKQGVDMDATTFWDLARRTRSELDAHFAGFMSPMRLFVVDEFITTTTMKETLEVLKMPCSCSADVMVSNIGKYEHETTFAFQTAADKVEDLKIDQVHVCGSFPHMGTATVLYVTSIDSLSYGFMHKYDDAKGQQLFKAIVATIERIGEIGGQESMLDVASAVQQAL